MSTPMSESSGRTIGDFLNVLRRRWGIAAFAFFCAVAFSFAFVTALPRLYRASATVLVQGQTAEALVDPSVPGAVGSRLQVIKQEALSRQRLTGLADQFQLYPEPAARASPQILANLMQRDIAVEVLNGDQDNAGARAVAFTVSYTGRDPETVAAVANELASFYLAQNKEMRLTQTARVTEFLGQQMVDMKARLASQEGRLRTYSAANTGAVSQQTDANVIKLGTLNVQLRLNGDEQVRHMERRQTLQSQMAALGSSPTVNDRDPVTRLAQLRVQLAELRTKWFDGYPDVKRAQDQVTALEREIADRARSTAPENVTRSVRDTLDAALRETNGHLQRLDKESEGLRREIATLERRIESAPGQAATFQMLTRDYQAARDQHDALLRRYDQATLSERAETTSGDEFRVLDSAIPIRIPAGPSRTWLFVLAIGFAAAFAVAAVLARDRLDTSFHSVDELREFTRVPVLASIPVIATRGDRFKAGLRALTFTSVSVVVLAAVAAGAFQLGRFGEPIVRLLLRLG